MKKIIIVGGVAGGASAATRARRVNPDAEIIIYEKGPAISFANCGLPYHLGGEIKDRSALLVATPELFKRRFNIQVKTEHEVLAIDKEKKQLIVEDKTNHQEFTDSYDELILSTGSELIQVPNIPYAAENVFSLWSLDDLDHIKNYFQSHPVKTVTVIGAGFVGLEVVEQLQHLGIAVQLVEMGAQVLGPLDPEMASFIEEELQKHQVQLYLENVVQKAFVNNNTVDRLLLSSGQTVATDALIVGVGVKPLSILAKNAGLATNQRGGLQVNASGQTSDPYIFAVGDMAETLFGPTHQPIVIPLAGPANRAGRIAGEKAAAGTTQFHQTVFATSIVRVFQKVAGSTGLSEKGCQREKLAYRVAYISAPHHASYYPGAKELVIKLIYAPDSGKILGAQILGEEGVDKRIDVIATLLHFAGTVADLAALDLSYAPPFGSAKDPLHQIAFVALNDLAHQPTLAAPSTDLTQVQCIDVRSQKERDVLPLDHALFIPIDGPVPFYEHPDFKKIDPKKPVIVVCHTGKRAHIVASYLQQKGVESVRNLTGGMMMRTRSQATAYS